MLHFFFDNSPRFQMIELDEASSTNSFLACHQPLHEVDMTLVTAEYQTAGRGQRGNTWESERSKNLLFSIMVKPQTLHAAEQFVLSQAIALAIQQAIASRLTKTTDACTVKWPNDIYVGNRKIAGILIENDLAGHNISRSIIGCGVNINQTAFAFPKQAEQAVPEPVSLAMLIGTEHERSQVLRDIMSRFSTMYSLICRGERASIHDSYMQSLYRREGFHLYRDTVGTFSARISSIEPTGHLHLIDTAGTDRRYAFKEVAFC